jgi:hypothetical protein
MSALWTWGRVSRELRRLCAAAVLCLCYKLVPKRDRRTTLAIFAVGEAMTLDDAEDDDLPLPAEVR